MQSITVTKEKLLDILRENREKHQAVFAAAMEGYAAAARDALENELKQLTSGPLRSIRLVLERPKDHTPDYDRVIRMVELHTGATIVLDEIDIQQYIQDDWTWKRAWAGKMSSYAPEAYARSYGPSEDD